MLRKLFNLTISLIIMSTPLSASTQGNSWENFKLWNFSFDELGMSLDLSRMNLDNPYLKANKAPLEKALKAMQNLEDGGIANPDEGWQVGHYWLRNPHLAPKKEITDAISTNIEDIKEFAEKVHTYRISGQKGPFKNLLIIGIGGSALGPQFVDNALGSPSDDKLVSYYIDNTDPDGIDLVWDKIGVGLSKTLVIVISKSGGTPETRNGMKEAEKKFASQGLSFGKHAVAITIPGSKLDEYAREKKWLASFPIWNWVGGRTSELSTVGLLPAALKGYDIDKILEGAKIMDSLTRNPNPEKNPACLLALAWFQATEGKGKKDMVIIPYKDRLSLLSKYLQQLVMESLGKEKNLKGEIVNQGISVFGNKGSTDQHSYIQQLRDGLNNFFVTFFEVLKDRDHIDFEIEKGRTSGDYLHSLLIGTKNALSEKNRQSITITMDEVSPLTIGATIALFERTVGIYATLIGVNAYNQPGVEAGKLAASNVLSIQDKIINYLTEHPNKDFSAEQIAQTLNIPNETEIVFKILEHLAFNTSRQINKTIAKKFHQNLYSFRG